jgi:hypothetical protein
VHWPGVVSQLPGELARGFLNTMKPCDKNINQTLGLVQAMVDLAEAGESGSEDDGCSILYGILRDSAHQIKKIAETEKEKHIKKGSWK